MICGWRADRRIWRFELPGREDRKDGQQCFSAMKVAMLALFIAGG